MKYCCQEMYQYAHPHGDHPLSFDEASQAYRWHVGSVRYLIRYCPWCGKCLSTSLPDQENPRFEFFNDTRREVHLHGGTFANGCSGEQLPIPPQAVRTLRLPPGTYPSVKLWERGSDLTLGVFPRVQQSPEDQRKNQSQT